MWRNVSVRFENTAWTVHDGRFAKWIRMFEMKDQLKSCELIMFWGQSDKVFTECQRASVSLERGVVSIKKIWRISESIDGTWSAECRTASVNLERGVVSISRIWKISKSIDGTYEILMKVEYTLRSPLSHDEPWQNRNELSVSVSVSKILASRVIYTVFASWCIHRALKRLATSQ